MERRRPIAGPFVRRGLTARAGQVRGRCRYKSPRGWTGVSWKGDDTVSLFVTCQPRPEAIPWCSPQIPQP